MKLSKQNIIIAGGLALIVAIYLFFTTKTTLSVIVPVYNSEKFLSQCLDSIFNQTGNYEVIAINDGSTDKSLDILRKYSQKHSNMKIINQKNQGVGASRNRGIKEAKGKYLIFVDSDDWLEENAFNKIITTLKKDNTDILLSGYYDVYDTEWVRKTKGEEYAKEEIEEKFSTRKLDKLMLFTPFNGEEALSDLFYSGTGVRGQVFAKKFIEEKKLSFPEEINCGEDDVFVYRAFLNNPKISVIASPLYNYRNRIDSLAKSKKVLFENEQGLKILEQSEEYKKANRRTQIYLKDAWLSWTILGISNILRQNQNNDININEAYKKAYEVYNSFAIYNKEERKNCRNLGKLRLLLFNQ